MKKVTVQVLSNPKSGNAYLLFPHPFNDWVETCTSVESNNVSDIQLIKANNSLQRAYLASFTGGNVGLPSITYQFTSNECLENNALWLEKKNLN